jgi:hypothetical protein
MSLRELPAAVVLLVTAGLAACVHPPAPSRSAPLAPSASPSAEPAPKAPPLETSAPTAPAAPPLAASGDPFESRVRPILERRCSPCHFSGGQMYDRLPFDHPEAVRSKPEALLRRLKVAEEHQVLEEWLRPQAEKP